MMTREAFTFCNQRNEIDKFYPACGGAMKPCDDDNREPE